MYQRNASTIHEFNLYWFPQDHHENQEIVKKVIIAIIIAMTSILTNSSNYYEC